MVERAVSFDPTHSAVARDVPHVLRYRFIDRGYRLHLNRREAFLSAFRLHNDTFNVWTHLFGVLLFAALFVSTWRMAAPSQLSPDGIATHLRHRLGDLRSSFLRVDADLGLLANGSVPLSQAHESLAAFSTLLSQRAMDVVPAGAAQTAEMMEALRGAAAAAVGELSSVLQRLMDATERWRDEPGDARADGAAGGLASRLGDGIRAKVQAWQPILPSELSSLPSFQALRTLKHYFEQQLHALFGAADDAAAAADPPPAPVEVIRQRLELLLAELSGEPCAATRPSELLERWPLFVFVGSAIICLAASVIYHLFGTANEKWNITLGRWDYAGIVCLIVGSTFPPIYYGFYTSAFYRSLYLASMLFLGSLLFGLTRFEFFYSPAWRLTRILLFVALGMVSVVPLVHLLWYHNFNQLSVALLHGVVKMGCVYLIGVVIYTTHLPEALVPHTFDYFFSSHQWWHLFVVFAAYLHFDCVVELWKATSTAVGACA